MRADSPGRRMSIDTTRGRFRVRRLRERPQEEGGPLMKRLLGLAGLGALVAALGVFTAVALAGDTPVGPGGEHKVVVCKYVGIPGVDEHLQTGGNPIVVDASSLGDGFSGTFPYAFPDAQVKSVAVKWTADEHFDDLGVC